jgi:hypothetical protein
VTGECVTEYSWIYSSASVDRYEPWGAKNRTVNVQRYAEQYDPPRADTYTHPDRIHDIVTSGKTLFAIIPNTVDRQSFTSSSDPWYSTVPATNVSQQQSKDAAGYRVAPGRPALSCWQQTSYVYGNNTVHSVFDLEELKGFNIPIAWHNHLVVHFSVSMVAQLGFILGRGILLSSATFLDGIFDAASSSAEREIVRLVLGAFVASREIFRDTTQVRVRYGLLNSASTPENRP